MRRQAVIPGRLMCLAMLALAGLAAGCSRADRLREPFGKTFYLDGAGNLGYGTRDVPAGLYAAGYKGDCEVFPWTTTHLPMVDQIDIAGAKRSARRLAREILEYKRRHPRQPVHIVSLSAGTGVTVWALERLRGRCKVENVFLLASSLSSNYDICRALTSVEGRVYVYHSEHDAILKLVQVLGMGTIDRRIGRQAAGQVGLHGRCSDGGKVVNIPWSQEWEKFGWHGGHTDCISQEFVESEIAPRILSSQEPAREQIVITPPGGARRLPKGEPQPAVPATYPAWFEPLHLGPDDDGEAAQQAPDEEPLLEDFAPGDGADAPQGAEDAPPE